jgi:hypothetical protein
MRSLLGRFHRPFARSAGNQLLLMNNLGDSQISATGFSGSALAQTLFKNCTSGADSLDVITIGDSNTGFVETSGWGYGYHTGMYKRFLTSASEYASPLYDAMLGTAGDSGHIGNIFGTGLTPAWPADNAAGNASGPGPIRGLVAANAASDADAIAVINYLGMDTANLSKPFGYDFQGALVTAGTTFQTGANKDVIIVGTTANIYLSGASMQYRVLHARTTTSGGQFKLGWWNSGSGATFGSYKSTNHTSVDVPAAETFNFNAPAAAYRVGWDGLGQGTSHRAVGPAPIIAHSLIRRSFKGFAFNNVMYDSGAPTTRIADRSTQMGLLLNFKLRELRDRQIEAGGNGNVVVVVYTGINGSESASTYTSQASSIVVTWKNKWAAIGGDPKRIAFVFVPTHPITTSINNWLTDRAAIVAAANAFAAATSGVCVCDIAQFYTGAQILSNGWYSTTTTQAHLKEAGYDAIGTQFFNSILA